MSTETRCTVTSFWQNHRHRLPAGTMPTVQSLRYHIRKRLINGMAAAGAVSESPLGYCLIDPEKFIAWANGSVDDRRAA